MTIESELSIDAITSDLQHMLGRIKELESGASIMSAHCEFLIESETSLSPDHKIMLDRTKCLYDELFNLVTALSLQWSHQAMLLARDLNNLKSDDQA